MAIRVPKFFGDLLDKAASEPAARKFVRWSDDGTELVNDIPKAEPGPLLRTFAYLDDVAWLRPEPGHVVFLHPDPSNPRNPAMVTRANWDSNLPPRLPAAGIVVTAGETTCVVQLAGAYTFNGAGGYSPEAIEPGKRYYVSGRGTIAPYKGPLSPEDAAGRPWLHFIGVLIDTGTILLTPNQLVMRYP